MRKYPECEKWSKVYDMAVAITGFWDWHFSQANSAFYNEPLEMQLYRYFEIDPNKLEAERRQMLKELQEGKK